MILSRATLHTARLLRRRGGRCYASTAHDEFDAVIVGGGPAGLALANALASSPRLAALRVILVEAGDLSKIKDWNLSQDSYSNRVSSITNASSDFLRATGAYEHLEHARTTPVHAMEVWDGVSDARISFAASDLGLSAQGMAQMTENLNIQRALLRNMSGRPQLELADNVKVATIEREPIEVNGWPIVHLSNGRSLCARLLIGADGLNSPVRKFAGIDTYGWLYNTHAVVATLQHAPRTPSTSNTVAYQRFLPTGPIAFLPLSPTVSSLVWSTTPELATALKGLDPAAFATAVNTAFRLPHVSIAYINKRLLEAHTAGTPLSQPALAEEVIFRERAHGIAPTSAFGSLSPPPVDGIAPLHAESLPPLVKSIQSGSVASFPLRYNHADTYIGTGAGARTVLVGDAAHTIHPLAGQGLNMGLADVAALAECIETAVSTGGDIGSLTALQPYARARYAANHVVMSAVDKLHHLYGTDISPVVWARSLGLEVVNELDSIKAALMLQAGAKARSNTSGGSPVLNAIAGGIDSVNDLTVGAKMIGGVVRNLVGAGVASLGQKIAGRP